MPMMYYRYEHARWNIFWGILMAHTAQCSMLNAHIECTSTNSTNAGPFRIASLINIATNIYDECKNLRHFATNWIPLFTFVCNDKIVYALCHELYMYRWVFMVTNAIHVHIYAEYVVVHSLWLCCSKRWPYFAYREMSLGWRHKSNVFVHKIMFEWHKIDYDVCLMVWDSMVTMVTESLQRSLILRLQNKYAFPWKCVHLFTFATQILSNRINIAREQHHFG